jgi:hypothetical protein
VHVVAPPLTTPFPTPSSVIEPGAHVAHATVDDAVYVPEPHAVHVVAPLLTTPVPAPTSVIKCKVRKNDDSSAPEEVRLPMLSVPAAAVQEESQSAGGLGATDKPLRQEATAAEQCHCERDLVGQSSVTI